MGSQTSGHPSLGVSYLKEEVPNPSNFPTPLPHQSHMELFGFHISLWLKTNGSLVQTLHICVYFWSRLQTQARERASEWAWALAGKLLLLEISSACWAGISLALTFSFTLSTSVSTALGCSVSVLSHLHLVLPPSLLTRLVLCVNAVLSPSCQVVRCATPALPHHNEQWQTASSSSDCFWNAISWICMSFPVVIIDKNPCCFNLVFLWPFPRTGEWTELIFGNYKVEDLICS